MTRHYTAIYRVILMNMATFIIALDDTFSFKWQCHEKGMEYRENSQFTNFYLSTIVWSVCIGFIALFAIFCWMQSKYITLCSFFCVQGWFFFIFGSIAAVHGGLPSFLIYFLVQFIIFGYILYRKCKNRGKHPYQNVRYDFEPESISRADNDEDEKL